MKIFILTMSNLDDVHDYDDEDRHEFILNSGVPYLSLESAQRAAELEVLTLNQDIARDDPEYEQDEDDALSPWQTGFGIYVQEGQVESWRAQVPNSGDTYLIRVFDVPDENNVADEQMAPRHP